MSDQKVGRPIVRGVNGSDELIQCRVPGEMKAHWFDHVKKSDEYETLTDLVIDSVNEKTGYVE